VVAGIAAVLDCVWILLVSIVLWRDPALALPTQPWPGRWSESLAGLPTALEQRDVSVVVTTGRHRG
jgi:hypothetical protein